MNVAFAAEARGRCLRECDTSNKSFEWTGHHQLSAEPPQVPACHSRAAFEGCVVLDQSQQGRFWLGWRPASTISTRWASGQQCPCRGLGWSDVSPGICKAPVICHYCPWISSSSGLMAAPESHFTALLVPDQVRVLRSGQLRLIANSDERQIASWAQSSPW